MKQHPINDVIKSIGMDGVVKYLPKGMKLHPCDIHGHFLAHYSNPNPLCEMCTAPLTPNSNGLDATQVEHLIDLRNDPLAQLAEELGLTLRPLG